MVFDIEKSSKLRASGNGSSAGLTFRLSRTVADLIGYQDGIDMYLDGSDLVLTQGKFPAGIYVGRYAYGEDRNVRAPKLWCNQVDAKPKETVHKILDEFEGRKIIRIRK